MKLIDMKMTKKEREENSPKVCGPGDSDGPTYPWGLKLDLNNDAIKKLDITELPKVGTYMTVTARACVVGVRSSERENHEDRSIELQIEELGLAKEGKSMKDAVDEGVEDTRYSE